MDTRFIFFRSNVLELFSMQRNTTWLLVKGISSPLRLSPSSFNTVLLNSFLSFHLMVPKSFLLCRHQFCIYFLKDPHEMIYCTPSIRKNIFCRSKMDNIEIPFCQVLISTRVLSSVVNFGIPFYRLQTFPLQFSLRDIKIKQKCFLSWQKSVILVTLRPS